jgi:hypothetical protein
MEAIFGISFVTSEFEIDSLNESLTPLLVRTLNSALRTLHLGIWTLKLQRYYLTSNQVFPFNKTSTTSLKSLVSSGGMSESIRFCLT